MGKTVVLTGGGTAGHVMPNLAIIPKLAEMGFSVEYIGTRDGMEREIIGNTGLPYHVISAGKLRRYLSLKNVTDLARVARGICQAKRLLKKIKPAVVFSKGGFVSVPVVMAASKLRIPVVLHESDFSPGLANRLCIPRADKVCVAFKPTLEYIPEGKGVYTGLPIRSALLHGNRDKGLRLCGFSGGKPVLLIMGGSMGARAVNGALDEVMPQLAERFDIAHIRGRGNMLDCCGGKGYKQFGFVDAEMPDLYAAADVMISRAGATSVFEILELAMPALLIPLTKASSRGDQLLNAEYFRENGFSLVLEQEALTPETILECVEALYAQRETLREAMKKEAFGDAAQRVAEVIAGAQRKH
jgi:UDP-N-acetylglucosamine--N-acetylmuramyl-(pentapeptide) pyrophosphoryl-undecaprenol N-acetylglucosamine transferase